MPQMGPYWSLLDDARELRAHHVDLPPRQAQVVALEGAGWAHGDIARLLECTIGAVRSSAYAAREKVVPLSRFRSRNAVVAWVWMHGGCCLLQAARRLQSLSIYSEHLQAIASFHASPDSERREIVLVAQALGHSVRTTADLLQIRPVTVEYHNQRLRNMLFPADADENLGDLVAWAHCHAMCCISQRWRSLLRPLAG